MPDPQVCRRCTGIVPWLSFWGNLSLAIYKLVVGLVGRSSALVADALHSFADVIGSAGIVIATKVSAKHPNRAFNYGFGKAEFLGAVFVYTLLLFFGAAITIGAIRSMLSDELRAPHFITAVGAVISVFYNYLMYGYATCVGKRNLSPAILADAFENRADAISSVACIVGILGAMYVHPILDPIAALIVGFIIVWNCQEQLREAARGLMDGALPQKELERIERIALDHDGVLGVTFVRTRQTGPRFWIDLGVEIESDLAVEEADGIATALKHRIGRFPSSHHVEVFVSSAEESVERSGAPMREPAV